MLTAMLVSAAVLSLSLAHWGSGGGSGSREQGGYCRDRNGYLYRCGDSSWGSGSRWNNYYGSGGYYESARYVGRGRVRTRGRGEGTELVCDFRRDGRLGYDQRIQSVVWKKVRDNYGSGSGCGGSGWYGGSGSYGSGSGSGYYGSGSYGSGSGYYGSGSYGSSYDSNSGSNYGSRYYGSGSGCGGGGWGRDRHYPSGTVAGWVTTSSDVSTLTLLEPRSYDAGRYRCIAQVTGRNSWSGGGRNLVYMEVEYRGSGGWGSGGSGGWGSGGWGSGGSGGWGSSWYRNSALKKTKPDQVVDGRSTGTEQTAENRVDEDE